MHKLVDAAYKVHLRPVQFTVPTGLVIEVVMIKVAAQLAVDAREKIFIEMRRNAGGIVISGDEWP